MWVEVFPVGPPDREYLHPCGRVSGRHTLGVVTDTPTPYAVSDLLDLLDLREVGTVHTGWAVASPSESPTAAVTADIATITSVKLDIGARTYPTTLASTDYDTLPFNTSSTVMPIMGLTVAPNGSYNFYPSINKSVQIVGTFGVPSGCTWLEQVREACEIQCARIYKRKDAPFGVTGTGALGQISVLEGLDTDVKALLDYPIRRLVKP